MKCCIKCRNFIYLLFLSTKLFKFEIQKYAQILCAHKPYFLISGHIYAHISYHFSWGLIDTNKKELAYGGSQPQITKNYAWFVSLSFID